MEEECEECEEGAPAWMATFSDMATLLLTFFVLLLSFANMDVQNFKSALGSVKEAFGVQTETHGDYEARASTLIELNTDPPSSMLNTKEKSPENEVQQLKNYIEQHGMQHRIEVMGAESGIVLRVKDIALFSTGSDELHEDSQSVLALVENLFNRSKAVLSIEGHTDNVPISKARFPSNWELSAARAAAVLRKYVAHGLTKNRLALAGYGELRPIASNDSQEGRNQNRRVEFVFRRETGYQGNLFDLANAERDKHNQDPTHGNRAQDDHAQNSKSPGTPAAHPALDREKPDLSANSKSTTSKDVKNEPNLATGVRDEAPGKRAADPTNIREQAQKVPQQAWEWAK